MQFAKFSTFLSTVLIAGTSLAQNVSTSQTPQQLLNATPTYAGTWNPTDGFVPATGPGSSRSGPETLYSNQGGAYFVFMPSGADQEWIDEGILADRNHDLEEQINGMQFSYVTNSTNPNGVNLTINFYDETIGCSGPTAWPVADCSYQLTGLQGSTNGNPILYVVDLEFAGVECNLTTDASNGKQFGMGAVFDEAGSGFALASGGFGSQPGVAWFDTVAGTYNGCFTFATGETGLAFDLFGPAAETEAFHSAAPGAFDNLFLSADAAPQVGVPVTFTVSNSPGGSGVSSMLWISPDRVDRHLLGTPYALDAHELAKYSTNVVSVNSATGAHTLTLPAIAGGGKTWYVQGATKSGGTLTAMSHGLEIYVP